MKTVEKLSRLRQWMKDNGHESFLMQQGNRWFEEHADPWDERFFWLTGLSTSAGYALITTDKAVVFINPLYVVKAKKDLDPSLFETVLYTDIWPWEWAKDHGIQTIAIDPWLLSKDTHQKIENTVGLTLLNENPIDILWNDRPPITQKKAVLFDTDYAGETSAHKIKRICNDLRDNNQEQAVISAPDSLAWLLNLRVVETPQNPGIQGYGILNAKDEKLTVYTDVDCSVYIGKSVAFEPLSSFEYDWLTNENDPCALPKARKNNIEQDGIRHAHRRDGAALTDLYEWIIDQDKLTEKDIASHIADKRSEANLYIGESFDPIVGFNANGAAIHGSPSDTVIEGDGLLLIDCGGQYWDGTTDITRTLAIGTPTQEMKQRYTDVLRAHIALANAVFPAGTTGIQLDAITRAPLWAQGIDFKHGTGHGVGHCLNVHEGPVNISPRGTQPLEPGMLFSNEPGYYKEDHFGIRLENLMLVQIFKDKNDPDNDTGKDFLCFETVTFVPFDNACILRDQLTPADRLWLDNYHAQIAQIYRPY